MGHAAVSRGLAQARAGKRPSCALRPPPPTPALSGEHCPFRPATARLRSPLLCCVSSSPRFLSFFWSVHACAHSPYRYAPTRHALQPGAGGRVVDERGGDGGSGKCAVPAHRAGIAGGAAHPVLTARTSAADGRGRAGHAGRRGGRAGAAPDARLRGHHGAGQARRLAVQPGRARPHAGRRRAQRARGLLGGERGGPRTAAARLAGNRGAGTRPDCRTHARQDLRRTPAAHLPLPATKPGQTRRHQ